MVLPPGSAVNPRDEGLELTTLKPFIVVELVEPKCVVPVEQVI